MNNLESQNNIQQEEKETPLNNSENLFGKILNLNQESDQKEIIDAFIALDAHYGHRVNAWNPLMSRYLFAEHGGVHIIDLTKTIYLLKNVLNDLIKLFSESNARILFVGSKEQLTDVIKSEAERCGQYYVNYRWFGGTLTNWSTIQKSIKKMDMIERELFENSQEMNKKEVISKQRVLNKLQNSLAGIRKMSNLPNIIFVTDTRKEKVAIAEANKLGIPVIALLDSNSNPRGVDYPIPCNDDNKNAVGLIVQLIADAVLVGMEISFTKRESAQKQKRDEKFGGSNSSFKRKSFVRKNDNIEQSSISSEEDNIKNNNSQQSSESLISNTDEKKPSNAINQAKLRKNFIAPQKNNAKLGGGFSSAASLLKKKSSNNIYNNNSNDDSSNKS